MFGTLLDIVNGLTPPDSNNPYALTAIIIAAIVSILLIAIFIAVFVGLKKYGASEDKKSDE